MNTSLRKVYDGYTDELSTKQATTAIFTLLYVILIAVGCFLTARSWSECWFSVMICVLGAILGWVAGIIASPVDPNEKNRFVSFGRAASAFLSGYVLSKFDKPFTKLVDRLSDDIVKGTILETQFAQIDQFRIISFICTFFLSMITVYVFRLYDKSPGEKPN